jgi:hypothetical protein
MDGMAGTRRAGRAAGLVLAACLLGNFIYAVSNYDRYGQSWDDPGDAAYGQATLSAYTGSSGYLLSGDRRYYGPAYFMLSAAVVELSRPMGLSWNPVDVRHLLNFLSYQVAILAFYRLARRLLSPGPAAAASLLFAFQPVLFGNAFINHKDIPFLAAFLVAVVLGIRIADRPSGVETRDSAPQISRADPSSASGLRRGLRAIGPVRRGAFVLLVGIGGLFAIDLLVGKLAFGRLESAVALAYQGTAWPPLNALFSLIAEDAHKTPWSAYAVRLENVYGWMRIVAAYLAILPGLIVAWMIARKGGADLRRLRATSGVILAASAALGIAVSIRVAGLFAGGLVTLAVVLERRRNGMTALAAYWILAGSLAYLLWPFLWNAPWPRLAEAVHLMGRFPDHFVLFRGQAMSSGDLPWDYLPTLLSIQLTEPVLVLSALGVISLVLARRNLRDRRTLLVVLGVWFLVPVLASVFLRVPLYSGFRQVFFALPPLFLMAGVGLEFLWQKVENRFMRVVLVLAILAPGLAGIGGLRPYEYIYYNAFIRGVRGAEGLFVHDYWCTSYREAMAVLNSTAEQGARIAIAEPFDIAAPFARSDLQLVRSRNDPQADYRLRCNNQGDLTSENLLEFQEAVAVSRQGVPLSVILRQATPAQVSP